MGLADLIRGGPRPSAAAVAPSSNLPQRPSTRTNRDVWNVWRNLGELNTVTSAKARSVARGTFAVTVDGRDLPEDESAEVIDEITGPDGQPINVADISLWIEVAGMVRYGRLTETGAWHVLGKPSRNDAKEHDVLVKVSNPDPEYDKRVTSPVLAALPVAREILLLSALGRAQARSRVSQRKILLSPTDQELRTADHVDIGDEIEKAFTSPISDEHSAAAVAPLRIGSPVDKKDGWFVLDLTSPFDETLPDRVDHLLRRLALSMDYPPEKLLGNMDSNHWNAWLSNEDAIRDHIQPAGAWPAKVFQRVLMDTLDTDDVQVTYVPPEPVTETEAGAAPGASTAAADVVEALQKIYLAVGVVITIEEARDIINSLGADLTGDPPSLVPRPSPASPEGSAAAIDPGEDLGLALARIDSDTATAGRVMVEAAVATSRARIGAQVRSAVSNGQTRDPALVAKIEGVSSSDVVATLGLDVAAVHIDRDSLPDTLGPLPGQWSGEVDRAWSRVKQAAEIARPADADFDRDQSVLLLVAAVAVHVWDTIEQTDARLAAPPTDAVRRALAVAGGNQDPGELAPDVAAVGPAPPSGSGIAVGRRALDAIQQATGLRATQWRWQWSGDSFPWHQAANGRFTNAEGQIVVDGAPWNPQFEGDHKGCGCLTVPVFS